jgi:hypothetical protein
MTEKTYKVGDVVAWDKVPHGALVERRGVFFVRLRGGGHVVGPRIWADMRKLQPWPWEDCDDINEPKPTIIALGLTGKETAAELQRLAEVYEVREAIAASDDLKRVLWVYHHNQPNGDEHLHAAGWRPGDSAERAAELLAAGAS